jgi:hypothetical protein
VKRETEQSPIPEVVDVRPQVGEGRRRRVRQAVEDLDQPALLGDEHSSIARESHDSRIRQPGEGDALLEVSWAASRRGRVQAPAVERCQVQRA